MTALPMIALPLYFAAGLLLAGVYFLLLRQSLRLHDDRLSAGGMTLFFLLRLLLAGGGFWLVAQQGAGPLLAALLGFVLMRFAAQRWMMPE
jgi:F1F0 ATPase subunit 2